MKNYILLTLLLVVFIALLGIGIIIPVMPVFARELGAGGFALGMIIASFSVTRGLLQPLVGNVSDRMGRKNFLMAGLLVYAFVGLLIPMAGSIFHLIGIRGFHGVGSAMLVPVAMAYVSLLAPSGQEGRYMSYLNVAIFCGIGCGPVIGGIISDLWGMPMVFYTMAALSFLALLLVWFYLPEKTGSEKQHQRRLLESLNSMVRNRKTLGILIARYATMIIMVPTMAFLPLLMSGWESSSGLQIGIVIACRTLVNALLQIPFGRLADRCNKSLVLGGCCTGMALILFIIPFLESFAAMSMAYLVLGGAEAGIWAILGTYASLEAKEHYGHGTMMGVFSFAMSGGVFTGAVLAGISMDLGTIARAYHVTSVTVLLLCYIGIFMISRGEKGK